MMRLTLAALAVCAVPATAVAAESTQLPIQCGEVAEVAEVVGKAGEKLLVHGMSAADTVWQYWVNLETGSWSVVSVTNGTRACLIGSGMGAEPYTGPQPQPPGEPA